MAVAPKTVPESAEQREAFDASLQDLIAHLICSHVSASTGAVDHVRDELASRHYHGKAAAVWQYLVGAATALNPLPPTAAERSWHSDQAALVSDWQSVLADMDEIWRAIVIARQPFAESAGDGYQDDQERRQDSEVERTSIA